MKIAVDYLTFLELAPTLDFEKYVLPGIRQERTKLFLYEYTAVWIAVWIPPYIYIQWRRVVVTFNQSMKA